VVRPLRRIRRKAPHTASQHTNRHTLRIVNFISLLWPKSYSDLKQRKRIEEEEAEGNACREYDDVKTTSFGPTMDMFRWR
jgi:hypothetical protein